MASLYLILLALWDFIAKHSCPLGIVIYSKNYAKIVKALIRYNDVVLPV